MWGTPAHTCEQEGLHLALGLLDHLVTACFAL